MILKMRIKKILIINLMIFILSANVYADTNDTEIFIRNIKKIESITADFIQKNSMIDFGTDTYTGKIVIVTKKQALWDYTDPANTWYLFSPTKLEYYDNITNQLVTYTNFSISDNILLQLLMDLSIINDSFKTTILDNKITLFPLTNIGIKYIEIVVEKSYMKSIKSIDLDDNSVEIIFSNMKYNSTIHENIFNKSVPADATHFKD